MRPYQNDDRLKKNIKYISRDNPVLARALESTKPRSRLVIDDNGDFNVDIGNGQRFYPSGARGAAERQVAQYLETPLRFQLAPNDVLEDCIELNWLYQTMRQRLSAFPALPAPASFGGFVVVFGIGLGQHIKLLAERLAFKTMIVIEPQEELLAHSLHVLDWQKLIQDLSRDGRDIRFVRGDNPFLQVIKIIRGGYYPFLDGSYFYLHYQSPELTALAQQLLNQCKAMSMASGWVEDQLTMMKNNIANFSRPGFLLQQRQVGSARKMPAFVVGAGPSLDADIEDIRRCREHVVLITASSALKVLLEHGIRPDIHCELENGAGLGLVAEDLAARHGLSDITLYASPTIDPRISPCFKRTVYFYRGHISSTVFYADGADTTSFAEPTSGNTAVHCALSLGFHEIYLFGLDFGARDPKQHHSQHSVYFTYKDESEMATYTPYEFDIPVPGNLGGQVMTGWVLDWGRTSVSKAIEGFDNVRVMNCSDGAQIRLATPKAAESIEIPPPPAGPKQEVESALTGFVRCDQDRSRPDDLAALVRTLHRFLDASLEAVSTITSAGRPPQAAILGPCERIITLLVALENGDVISNAAFRIMTSHIQGGLVAAYHYASRLDPTAAEEGLAAIRCSLAESFQRLHPLIDAAFESRRT